MQWFAEHIPLLRARLDGSSYATLAAEIGVTRTRAHQIVYSTARRARIHLRGTPEAALADRFFAAYRSRGTA